MSAFEGSRSWLGRGSGRFGTESRSKGSGQEVAMAMPRSVHRLAGRSVAVLLCVLILALLSVGVARASSHLYFVGNSCCAHREFAGYEAYMTQNSASNGGGYVECVQEQVFSGGGSFFDTYKCQPGSVSHPLNGQNPDQALCWINAGPSPAMTCSENY